MDARTDALSRRLPSDLELASARLTLRPWRPGDAADVAAAMSDPRMHRFLTLPDPYGEADARSFLAAAAASETTLERAVVESASGRLVGSIALRPSGPGPHDRSAELGYAIYPGAQGNGYAAEAVRVLTEWALTHGAERVELSCGVENLASAKTALTAGFRFEGVARRGVRIRDVTVDAATFARTAGDAGEPVARSFPALPAGGLTDGVVLLRELAGADAEALHQDLTDPLTVANGFTGVAPTREVTAEIAARGGLDWLVGTAAPFAIVDVASGAFAGSIRLRHAGPPGVGGIGYSVHPAFRGRGMTARALRLLVAWAFSGVAFARLELGAKPDNVASQRAALAAGFEPDGVRAARLRRPDGSYADEVRFVLVKPQIARRMSP